MKKVLFLMFAAAAVLTGYSCVTGNQKEYVTLDFIFELDLPYYINSIKVYGEPAGFSPEYDERFFEAEYQNSSGGNFPKGQVFTFKLKDIEIPKSSVIINVLLSGPDSETEILHIVYLMSELKYGSQYRMEINRDCEMTAASSDPYADAELMLNKDNNVIVLMTETEKQTEGMQYSLTVRSSQGIRVLSGSADKKHDASAFLFSSSVSGEFYPLTEGTEYEITAELTLNGSLLWTSQPLSADYFENGKIYCFRITENPDGTFSFGEV